MTPTSCDFLKEIAESEDSLIYGVMGDFGLGLKGLTNSVDLNHPELNSLFEDFCKDDKTLLNKCFEFFKIMKYAKKNGYSNSAFLLEQKLSSIFNGRLFNQMANIKLIKSRASRDKLRSSKKPKKLEIGFLYRDNFWHSYPCTFSRYLRYSSSYQEDIEVLLLRKKIYLELECLALVDEIDKEIEHIKDFNKTYYGFHQIKSTDAAIILAKLLNFTFKKEGIFVQSDSSYCPFICPTHEVIEFLDTEVKDKLLYLDALPEADNKPIFDLIVLLVPTCFGRYSFEENDYKNVLQFFVKNKIFSSILLGEKGGKFYFIDLTH